MRKIFSLFSILLTTMAVLTAQSMMFNMNLQDGGAGASMFSKINKFIYDKIPALQNHKEFQDIMKSLSPFQNYLDVANPTTTIRYEAPEAGIASIKIYGFRGRLVRNISLYTSYSGAVEFAWDGKDNFGKSVANGHYFYQVLFGEKILTKRTPFVKLSR